METVQPIETAPAAPENESAELLPGDAIKEESVQAQLSVDAAVTDEHTDAPAGAKQDVVVPAMYTDELFISILPVSEVVDTVDNPLISTDKAGSVLENDEQFVEAEEVQPVDANATVSASAEPEVSSEEIILEQHIVETVETFVEWAILTMWLVETVSESDVKPIKEGIEETVLVESNETITVEPVELEDNSSQLLKSETVSKDAVELNATRLEDQNQDFLDDYLDEEVVGTSPARDEAQPEIAPAAEVVLAAEIGLDTYNDPVADIEAIAEVNAAADIETVNETNAVTGTDAVDETDAVADLDLVTEVEPETGITAEVPTHQDFLDDYMEEGNEPENLSLVEVEQLSPPASELSPPAEEVSMAPVEAIESSETLSVESLVETHNAKAINEVVQPEKAFNDVEVLEEKNVASNIMSSNLEAVAVPEDLKPTSLEATIASSNDTPTETSANKPPIAPKRSASSDSTLSNSNRLCTEDINGFLEQLFENDPDLVDLDLSGCQLLTSSQGAQLADALSRNTVLQSLDLSGTKLNTQTAMLIGKALQTNDTLKKLNLERNSIGPAGFKAIALGLMENKKLRELKLLNQTLSAGTNAEQFLAKAMAKNHHIVKMTIAIRDPSSRGVVDRAISRNNEVQRRSIILYTFYTEIWYTGILPNPTEASLATPCAHICDTKTLFLLDGDYEFNQAASSDAAKTGIPDPVKIQRGVPLWKTV
ncbi:Tropomodulin-2 [Chytriomyces hyalinus]|nr:Tropomodulin-2 [Chytriomyces hyalinus]